MVQIAGTLSKSLVFDVQCLLEAPDGLVTLITELRSLLVDSRICKVKCCLLETIPSGGWSFGSFPRKLLFLLSDYINRRNRTL